MTGKLMLLSRIRVQIVIAALTFALSPFLVSSAMGTDPGPVKASRKAKCPVCGMFVYKYPDWIGEIIFREGSVVFFDGAKDLFKYYFNLNKYKPGKTHKDIAAIYVTEYYDVEFINAKRGFFVTGSDVYGPMGRELIPFRTRADAETFRKDHKGERIFSFEEISPSIIEKLD